MAGITPWATGQTLPAWVISLVDDNRNVVDLTGATSVSLSFLRGPNATAGAGTAAIVSPPTLGQVSYVPAAADVAVAGTYTIRVAATFPGGTVISDPIPWTLLPSASEV
jgi:hypothetical protein